MLRPLATKIPKFAESKICPRKHTAGFLPQASSPLPQDESWKNLELAPKNQSQETKIQVQIMQNPKFAHENRIPASISHLSYLLTKKKTHDQRAIP
jgi:hypothetical protein